MTIHPVEGPPKQVNSTPFCCLCCLCFQTHAGQIGPRVQGFGGVAVSVGARRDQPNPHGQISAPIPRAAIHRRSNQRLLRWRATCMAASLHFHFGPYLVERKYDRGAHAIHGGVVLARIARVLHQPAQRPQFDSILPWCSMHGSLPPALFRRHRMNEYAPRGRGLQSSVSWWRRGSVRIRIRPLTTR